MRWHSFAQGSSWISFVTLPCTSFDRPEAGAFGPRISSLGKNVARGSQPGHHDEEMTPNDAGACSLSPST